MTDAVTAEDVSVASIRMLGEDVLVRPAPREEVRASGLFVPNTPSESWTGGVFYGVVVAVGPGRLVEKAPPAEAVANIALCAALVHKTDPELPQLVSDAVRAFVETHTKHERVPLPWKVGDHVACRRGFGPEVLLREGRHHVVGRGSVEHGHGIIMSWEPGHVHCWHLEIPDSLGPSEALHVRCRCGIEAPPGLQTRLPACSTCPPGERLVEAVPGGKISDVKIGPGDGPGIFEERPVDDGRDDL